MCQNSEILGASCSYKGHGFPIGLCLVGDVLAIAGRDVSASEDTLALPRQLHEELPGTRHLGFTPNCAPDLLGKLGSALSLTPHSTLPPSALQALLGVPAITGAK